MSPRTPQAQPDGDAVPSDAASSGDAPHRAPRRRWWWRRRPPASHTRFARGVWWAGHLQLPISLVLFVVCLPLLVATTEPALGFDFPAWFGVVGTGVDVAWIGLAMAGPFALSGLMLRASSHQDLYAEPPVGGRLIARVLGLAATVAGIAVVSILLTIVAAYLLLFIFSAVLAS
ncbi:hypothetical protein [Agromyces arachidis]|uniref:hypothetical protein n=1 Tax=Agromyces arachidis TaxID=766966 RepID=UPI004057A64E